MKKLLSILLSLAIIISSIECIKPIEVYADESKILTLGKDLTEEQRQLVIDYLGVDESQVIIIEINNQDEHELLDGIATQQQIGTRTFSCSYIEPTEFGGIHIKTVNLSWVTCEMIRNALITSGITNCNVICISPIEVSGTGSLTGIFKAYENISGVEITEEAKELASEELITTCTIAGTIGQEEASSMVSELKEEIITNEVTSQENIEETVRRYIDEHNLQVTEDDMWKLVELLIKISEQDYDIEEIKEAYKDIKQTAEEIKEATEKTVGFFEKIVNWLKSFWNWLTGKAKEIEESEQLEQIKNTMGILAETNDSLLGNNTIVTNTDEEVMQEIQTNETEVNTEEEKKPWYQWILNIFNSGNKEDAQIEKESGTEEEQKTFDDFQSEAEKYQEELESLEDNTEESSTEESSTEESSTEESKTDTGLLQYIRDDYDNITDEGTEQDDKQSDNNTDEVKSFDELAK